MKSAAYNEVIKLAVAFNFLFSSFLAAKVLQTSLHKETGYFCLSVLYVVFTFAAIVAPSIVHRLGTRWSLVFGAVPYVVFVASNLYPTFAVMIVPCGLVGLGAGALWTAQGVHMGQLASLEAARTGVDVVVTSSKFNGMFYGIFQFSGAIGGVASSAILISFPESGVWVLFTVLTIIGAIALFALSRIHPAAQLVNTLQPTSHDSIHADLYPNDGFASRSSSLGGSRHASESGLELTARGSTDPGESVHAATTSTNNESGYDMRELAVYEQDMAAAQQIELPESTTESRTHGSPPLQPIGTGQVVDFGSPVSPARSYGRNNDDAADDSAGDYNEFFTPEPTPRKQRGHSSTARQPSTTIASGTRAREVVISRGQGAGAIGSPGLSRSLLQSPPYEPDNTQWYTPKTAETSNSSTAHSFVTPNGTQAAADVTNLGGQRTPHVRGGTQHSMSPAQGPSRNHSTTDSPVLADLSPMHTMYQPGSASPANLQDHSAAGRSPFHSGLRGGIQVGGGLMDDPDVSNDITQHGRGEWHAATSPDSSMHREPTQVVYTGTRSATVDAPRSPGARPHHRPVHGGARTHTHGQDEPDDQIVDVEQALKRAAEPKTPRIRDVVMLAARDRRMLLFIPIIVYNGMSEAFLFADFFGEFVKPLLGIGRCISSHFPAACASWSDTAAELCECILSSMTPYLPRRSPPRVPNSPSPQNLSFP